MASTDYSFYTASYLLGKPATVPETLFEFYVTQAEAEVKNIIRLDAIDADLTDPAKMAACEIAEILYKYSDDAMGGEDGYIRAGITSEKVGEYSVSYGGNTARERTQQKAKEVRQAGRKWLGPAGLLFRGTVFRG